jgi:PAS domain S-box-containing protein
MTRANRGRVGQWLCLGGASLGALGLLGWILKLDPLTTILPGQPPMMPNTAIGLMLVGYAGWLRSSESRGRLPTALGRLAAIFALTIGVVTLAEYAFSTNLLIDDLLFEDEVGPRRGRPSPAAAFALTLLSTAVLLIDVRPTARVRPSECVILLAGLMAFTSLTGFVLGSGPVYRPHAPVIGVALHTSISLLLTSVGLLLVRPVAGLMRLATSSGPGGVLLRRLALPAIVAPVLIGLVVIRFSDELGFEETSLVVAVLTSVLTVLSLFLLGTTAVPLNRSHDALESSRAQTRNLLEHAPEGIFVADLEGRYTDVNDAGCRMLGFTREEILRMTIMDLIPDKDAERLRMAKGRLLEGGTEHGEWSLRRKDGTIVPVDVSASILPDGRWQALVHDISSRKRLEYEHTFLAEIGPVLATTLDYEETLTRIADVGARDLADLCVIYLVNEGDGEINRSKVVCNDATFAWACEVLRRLPPNRRPGDLISEVLDNGLPVLVPHLSTLDVAALFHGEERFAPPHAAQPHSGMATPLVSGGKVLGVIGLLSATPSRVYGAEDLRLANELAQRATLAVENARLYRAAQRAIQDRDDVLGIVAHDLRNPLGTILMQAQLLRRRLPDRERKPRERIERAATRMNRLIQDMLDVARVEAGRLTVLQDRLPVGLVLEDAFEARRAEASARSLEFRLDFAPGLPEVWADRDRLLQVLENLIGNAFKFTEPGGRVVVGATWQDGEVVFRVEDTGAGIAPQDQPRVFDRFWQAHNAQRHGAGLGLPIVRGIVEAHGGRVWLESLPGHGSTFFFTIPIARLRNERRLEHAPHP